MGLVDDSRVWAVHLYEPGHADPALYETFGTFADAYEAALAIKLQRPNGWHVHVHPPADAPADAIDALRRESLYPG